MITAPNPLAREVRKVADDYLMSTQWRDDDGSPRYDRVDWQRACADLDVAALIEPEADGGAGGGAALFGEVLQVAGRRLSPLPLLGSAVLAQSALRLLAEPALRAERLPDLLSGDVIGTVAPWRDGALTGVTRSGSVLDGTVPAVLEGDTADMMLLPLVEGDQVVLVEVDLASTGLRRTALETVDLSRSFARVDLTGVAATVLGTGPVSRLDELDGWFRWAVACDQLGLAEQSLESILDYVKVRVQYGRIIGSFQAIKHQCADLALAVDDARSALAHLTWSLEESPEDLAVAGPLAAVVCGDAAAACSEAQVHLHGGVGFTWEHPAHRFVRRAMTDRALFRATHFEREAVLTASGV